MVLLPTPRARTWQRRQLRSPRERNAGNTHSAPSNHGTPPAAFHGPEADPLRAGRDQVHGHQPGAERELRVVQGRAGIPSDAATDDLSLEPMDAILV